MSSSCRTVREQLPWFAGDDLDARTAAEVRAHLVDCLACRREASVLQRATAALGSCADAAGTAETPAATAMFADLHRSIVAAVAAEPAPRGTVAAGLLRRATGWHPGWRVVVAASVLVAVGFWGGIAAADRRADGASRMLDAGGPHALDAGTPLVVPYAGPRVALRPLAEDRGDEVEAGPSGLLVRRALRQLVDDGVPVPPLAVPPKASTGASAAEGRRSGVVGPAATPVSHPR